MKAELCKTCIHTNVCCRDKNTVGDRFVMGHPMFFDNDELFKKYKEWEANGFPCDEYLAEPIRHGRWEDRTEDEDGIYEICSVCHTDVDITHYGKSYAYCPNCGAKMDEVTE